MRHRLTVVIGGLLVVAAVWGAYRAGQRSVRFPPKDELMRATLSDDLPAELRECVEREMRQFHAQYFFQIERMSSREYFAQREGIIGKCVKVVQKKPRPIA